MFSSISYTPNTRSASGTNSDTSIRDRIRNTNVPKITPSATTSIIFFLCITIIYAFMVIYTTISANSLSNVELSINNPIYTFIYILFLVTGTYFINVNVSKTICNENTIQWSRVLLITILPWIMIFGVLYFILELFPGWSSPFSNTFGWVIINALGATEVLERILKKYSDDGNTTLKKALENINNNKSRFINEIDIEQNKYKEFINQLSKESFTKLDSTRTSDERMGNTDIIQLFALINIKHQLGKIFWYILGGTLISAISYNFIVNMTCEKSLAQSTQEYEELQRNTATPLRGSKWRKLAEKPTEIDNINYTGRLSTLINNYGNVILNRINQNLEVELTSQELREVGLVVNTLPRNSYIILVDSEGIIGDPGNVYLRPIQ